MVIKEIKFPFMEQNDEEIQVTVDKLLVKDGDIIKKDDCIMDVNTDKAYIGILSDYEGKIKFNVVLGEVVKSGQVLATINENINE